MTENKPELSDSSNGANDLFGQIDEITQLENKVIDLKKKLLMNSALGTGEGQFEQPSFLLIKSANRTFAAPLKYVNEIVEMPSIQPLPKPVSSIAGTVNYHGELVAVIDVEELTVSTNTPIAPSQVLIICTIKTRRFALKVDEALEVVTVEAKQITMTDQVLPGIIRSSGLLRIKDQESALILDLMWIAIGAHLGSVLSEDAATPKE